MARASSRPGGGSPGAIRQEHLGPLAQRDRARSGDRGSSDCHAQPGRPLSLAEYGGARAAKIGKDTVAPEGGAIFRDATGSPTGILQERANELADRAVPAATEADCDAATMRAQDEALKRGVTGVESLEQASSYAALRRARERGELKVRALMGIPHRSLALSLPTTGTPPQIRDTAQFDFDTALATGMRTGQGDEWLQLGHVKFFTDGALGSQTAALEEPYEGTDDRGILTFDPMELRTDVARAAAGGLAVAIHAIGDRAVHIALDAVAPTRITSPALRQRLEHIQLVREEDLGRFGALGVIASMQPIHCTSDRDIADRYWGPKRTPRAYPWRTLLERRAVLAFGSDAPVEPIDPLLGIHAAVSRRRPGDRDAWFPAQRLTLDEAIHAYTAERRIRPVGRRSGDARGGDALRRHGRRSRSREACGERAP